ncbi:ABC-three component system protein [Tardiphaga sp. 42S5]|uniref:ABC-three component system protein n=1 Tax=Tardiphaga sp. 42S5 TaxID=1404799 RepID=UPI002A5AA451|nr:ABC-three component system protein [Tardiphaga sp. 42S5]WPO42523.1 ABC-three component system protein [Tardiphaga sp. 42S5]
MKFAYEDLSPEQFETLIVLLCQKLLGISVQGFAKGPDGGRDAKFVGTAELHPSKAAPWVGTTIIQAKHTNGYNRSFSEADFFSLTAANSVLGKELPRVKKLRDGKLLDHYMLFSNRRLAGNAENDISSYISGQCGLPASSIYLCGVEQLELWLKNFDTVAKLANLDPIDSPLIVSPDDLAEVVQALARSSADVAAAIDAPPTPRMSFEDKNTLNNMTADYAKALRKRYLKETSQIRAFLAAPENADILKFYEAVVEEFQLKIVAKRQDYQTFDNVMEHLLDLLFARDPILRQLSHKRLTRAVLFYMYWNCDIGEEADATTH